MSKEFDVIVVGGGPSGATAAMYLSVAKKKVLFLDMVEFPRDKICGDAQGRRAANIMKELGIYEGYTKLEGQPIYGLTLSSPNGTLLDIDVEDRKNPSPGFVHRRQIFDNYLFQHAKRMVTEAGGEFRVFKVTAPIVENGVVKGVKGTNKAGKEEEHRAKIVLAADGANSIFAHHFGLNKNPLDHFIVALRAYYTDVDGMTDRIELHLLKNLIPGYFWIFPLPNKTANVGLGMIVEDMNKHKVNLQEVLLKEIKENPLFKDRFKNAKLEPSGIRGWSLPVASYHRKCYLPGVLFLGDSASLIDPLSGEGVGNAMISGKIGAEVAVESMMSNDVSEKFLKKYDTMLWEVIGPEIQTNYRVQRIAKQFPSLIDKLIVRARKDEKFRKKIEELIPYGGKRQGLVTDDFMKELHDYKLPA